MGAVTRFEAHPVIVFFFFFLALMYSYWFSLDEFRVVADHQDRTTVVDSLTVFEHVIVVCDKALE